MNIPTSGPELVLWLIGLGITLSEQDQEKILANVLADKDAADAATEANRALDAPKAGN
jgi:hypothetical protein